MKVVKRLISENCEANQKNYITCNKQVLSQALKKSIKTQSSKEYTLCDSIYIKCEPIYADKKQTRGCKVLKEEMKYKGKQQTLWVIEMCCVLTVTGI